MKTDTVASFTTEQLANPAALVTQLLMKHQHPAPQFWEQMVDPDAFTHPDINYRRFVINRYWRTLLSRVPNIDTMDDRFCLVDEGCMEGWAALFENRIVPCIIRLNLAVS